MDYIFIIFNKIMLNINILNEVVKFYKWFLKI